MSTERQEIEWQDCRPESFYPRLFATTGPVTYVLAILPEEEGVRSATGGSGLGLTGIVVIFELGN